jgi:hypothetical protein
LWVFLQNIGQGSPRIGATRLGDVHEKMVKGFHHAVTPFRWVLLFLWFWFLLFWFWIVELQVGQLQSATILKEVASYQEQENGKDVRC